jgi:hypothetical protein
MIYNFTVGLTFSLVLGTTPLVFAQDSSAGNNPDIQKIVQAHIESIKKEKKVEDKYKKLTELIDLTNKEFNNFSNIVTDLKIKILEADGNVPESMIKEKDKNEATYNSWATYKVSLEPNYELFVEKNDKYHCDVVSQEIWQGYAPIGATEKKVELDAYTRQAVESSVEVAVDICNAVLTENSLKTK